MNKLQMFNAVLFDLRRNYPQGVTTWGYCCTKGCKNMSRGSGKCAKCCEAEIAEIIDNKIIANKIHESTRDVAANVNAALEIIDETENT